MLYGCSTAISRSQLDILRQKQALVEDGCTTERVTVQLPAPTTASRTIGVPVLTVARRCTQQPHSLHRELPWLNAYGCHYAFIGLFVV